MGTGNWSDRDGESRYKGVGRGLEGAGRKKSQKSQQCGKERDPGESLDAEEMRQGPEGLALTAALALGTARRLCCFPRFSLLLSSIPLP